ncbi:hypothetical protein N0Y54_33960 [Nostoc punctiforme UO1]|uniref:hypothetical protein n=1 Tax=Nostoc punctiforme TaxID=272131 RepID=UPI0030A89991
MRFLRRLQPFSNFTTSLGIKGVLAFVIGSLSCSIITVWVGIIVIGNILNPHKSALQMIAFYGSASVVAGFPVAHTGVWIADIAERIASEELRHLRAEVSPQPHSCLGCKHLHGVIYNEIPLICAIHPYSVDREHCPDWEKNIEHIKKRL